MIEFLLIFALGFLAAAILAMLITPAIYGRIVKLTEKRIEATVPLSLSEIRGKTDQLRAAFASESAKLTTELKSEREEVALAKMRAEKLQSDLAALAGDKKLADQHIEELVTEGGELRSDGRKKQQLIDKLSETMREFERMKKLDTAEIARLHNDLITVSTEVESTKIDLAASHTEMVNLRTQLDTVSMERDQLLNDIATVADAAQTLEQTMQHEQEAHNQTRIELAAAQSSHADTEAQLKDTFELLELQKSQLGTEIKTLEDSLKAAAEAAVDQDNMLQKEKQEHEATRIELAAAQSGVADRDSQLAQLDGAMKQQANELNSQIDRLVKQGEKLTSQLTREAERYSALEDKLNAEKDGHKQTGIELKTAHAAFKDSVAQHDKTRRENAKTAAALEKQIKALQLEGEKRTSELETTHKRREALEADLSNEKAGHKETRIDLAARQSVLDERIRQLGEANAQIDELHKRVEETSEAHRLGLVDLQKAQRDIEALNGRVENTKAALEKSRMTERGGREQIIVLKAGNRQLKKDLKASQSAADDLQKRLENERERTLGRSAPDNSGEQDLATAASKREDAQTAPSEHITQSGPDDTEQSRPEQQQQIANGANGLVQAESLTAEDTQEEKRDINGTVKGRMEDLRERHTALVDKLKNTPNTDDDTGMREEIAAIAAAVVGLSGQREGEASPIHEIISDAGTSDHPGAKRVSLASRAKSELEG
ncbi:hypothetical protein [Hoeflea prorocentri]|uniref:Uncharacterized protein n=1 Tax=Hoeflea prorocentri TaxID=1922333 RepID=A0A9X3ZG30_9HYPH|nr:hypothetical protein [Hoeflea prorocentri]MCY6379334.1 hypothetical protein [Hoeflea prorocentri]MDA5397135.1 hypothetical protein [Hoeflea prorocentri]